MRCVRPSVHQHVELHQGNQSCPGLKVARRRLHAKTARAIDATFNQHTKEKTVPPATFLAQAIKFLQTTDSTAPERVPQRAPVLSAAQRAEKDSYERLNAAERDLDRLYAKGREPTPAELAAFKAKYPDYIPGVGISADSVDPSTDFRPRRELRDDQ
jgi:hypothetical protein